MMTLPTSLRQESPENYSGQGRDQDGDDSSNPSATPAASGEEREMEGSSEGGTFPGRFRLKPTNMDNSGVKLSPETNFSITQTEAVTVAEHTTLLQWQLVEQPTASPQKSLEPDPAEEARGEIVYVRRPTHDLSSFSSRRGEGSSNAGLTPVYRKHSKVTSREEVMTSMPEALMEVLTTSHVTTVELLTTSDPPRTEPSTTAAATDKPSDGTTTEEPPISISWDESKREKTSTAGLQDSFSATPAPTEGTRMTTGVSQLTTFASDLNAGVTEMESRSAVSESFVVGGQWTHFKAVSPKSDEHKASVTENDIDNKDTNNHFGIFIPNWAFGLIPSGA